MSAHWEDAPATLGTVAPEGLMYDFGGFPRPLYEVEYDAPGAAELADDVAALVPGIARRHDRAWDHGVWVPLLHMLPAADVPVLQISLPSRNGAAAVFALGEALRPLRSNGVLLLGSGGLVHNLRRIDWKDAAPPETWATDFEAWVDETIATRDWDRLVDFEASAPAPRRAHPTFEHFLPFVFAAGAAGSDFDEARSPVTSFEYGSLSRRAIEFRG